MQKVTPLGEGSLFTVERMEGTAWESFPRHTASIESVLGVTEGQCVIPFRDASHALRSGDTFVVLADEWHQVVADPAFQDVHVMPTEIRFELSE